MAHQFRDDYVLLGLEETADWASAQVQYRRQVNRWHPDRFIQKPRERLHAEQRFIQLTKAFERIRSFYRINSRLPFEFVDKDFSAGAEAPAAAEGDAQARSRHRVRDIERPQFRRKFFFDSAGDNLTSSVDTPNALSLRHILLWLLAGGMMAATAMFFVVLDRNSQRSSLEEARRHLIERAPSDHQPSAAELNNRSRRGAFVEGGGPGKMGDMLMPDVFR